MLLREVDLLGLRRRWLGGLMLLSQVDALSRWCLAMVLRVLLLNVLSGLSVGELLVA